MTPRNPQDATRRNVRAANTKIALLTRRVRCLERIVARTRKDVEQLWYNGAVRDGRALPREQARKTRR